MLLRCGLFLAILSCVQLKDYHSNGIHHFSRFSSWPSFHNGATMLRIRRAANQTMNPDPVGMPLASSADTQGFNEGNGEDIKEPVKPSPSPPPKDPTQKIIEKNDKQTSLPNNTTQSPAGTTKNSSEISNKSFKEVPEAPAPTVIKNATEIKDNGTSAEQATKKWDLSNPEATKRGLIVFGGFALLAMAYFIFYRTKSKFNEAGNSNSTNESNQFRYGVLQSDDRRDNLELSRVPLTMESDDEEDEDLEIFDLGQKKKSLSYVNLQGTDEDIVLSSRQDTGRDELLLDIDDDSSDILINWSSNGKKS